MALKENGGVIQIVALDEFVKQDTPEKAAATVHRLAVVAKP
jgi:microsomal dipeptidase-like Zn-dependent dipeptidase